jgi:hypothetical protein
MEWRLALECLVTQVEFHEGTCGLVLLEVPARTRELFQLQEGHDPVTGRSAEPCEVGGLHQKDM